MAEHTPWSRPQPLLHPESVSGCDGRRHCATRVLRNVAWWLMIVSWIVLVLRLAQLGWSS